jgi:hypothetical protein
MVSHPTAETVLEQLSELERADDLARLVRTVALTAADEGHGRLHDGLKELLDEAGLSHEDGAIGDGNVLGALEAPAGAGVEIRRQLSALLARGVALDVPEDEPTARRLAERLAWLSAHTVLDGLWALDAALGPEAERLYGALGRFVAAADSAEIGLDHRPSALAAASALAASESVVARSLQASLLDTIGDSALRRALAPAAPAGAPVPRPSASHEPAAAITLCGELVPPPLRGAGLVLWALTGLLIVRLAVRWLLRLVLRLRRPAELHLRADGLTLESTTVLLGRKLRQAEVIVPKSNLARASREIRYPRLALYAGLLSLCVGSYVGISLFVDGARAGSPSLLGLGAVVFGAGVLLDLLLSVILPGRQGKVRVVVTPRKGRAFALLTPDADAARAALRKLSAGS